MPRYEYKIVPAPERAEKVKGLKGPARFAATLEAAMNELGADGWQYLRADTLPVEERAGLASKQTVYRNLLVFIKEIAEDAAEEITETVAEEAPAPSPLAPPPAPTPPPLQTRPPQADVSPEPRLANLFSDDRTVPPSDEDDRVIAAAKNIRRSDPKS